MEATIKKVNGVDVKRLEETIDAVKANSFLAMFRFKVSNKWVDGGLNRSTIKEFFGAGGEDETRTNPFVLDNDEPDVLLGSDKAPNPAEYVLHALAGCITTSMAYHSAAHGFKIHSIETKFEGDLDLRGFLGMDKNVRPGYENIRVSVKIDGDLTKEQKEQILSFGPSFSPVFDIITNKVPIQLSLVN